MPVRQVVVAVPARNEAPTIAGCLASLFEAAHLVEVPVRVVVAADSCHDDTAVVARDMGRAGGACVEVIEGEWHTAGRARAAAVDHALGNIGRASATTAWIANTDADCVVPTTWLRDQLAWAADGADAVLGVVDLDPERTDQTLLSAFVATYVLDDDTHDHVHGANFGVRANYYWAAGGWSTTAVVGEDHKLEKRLRSIGADIRRPSSLTVVTSSRTVGRLPAGFAHRLAHLADGSPVPASPHTHNRRQPARRTTIARSRTLQRRPGRPPAA